MEKYRKHRGIYFIVDQVKFAVGTAFRRRNSGSHFHIGTCSSIWKSGGKRASPWVCGLKTGVKYIHIKDLTAAEEE